VRRRVSDKQKCHTRLSPFIVTIIIIIGHLCPSVRLRFLRFVSIQCKVIIIFISNVKLLPIPSKLSSVLSQTLLTSCQEDIRESQTCRAFVAFQEHPLANEMTANTTQIPWPSEEQPLDFFNMDNQRLSQNWSHMPIALPSTVPRPCVILPHLPQRISSQITYLFLTLQVRVILKYML
jgi:hypothetical protein